jgi:hypothetical protein
VRSSESAEVSAAGSIFDFQIDPNIHKAMGNWFLRLIGSDSAPPPAGFRRISELPCSTPERDYSFVILDWQLAPSPPNEFGSILIWLEIEGQREPFFLTKKEASHYDSMLSSSVTHIRVVKNRGCYYVLPVNPRKETVLRTLPPPPKVFPPPK